MKKLFAGILAVAAFCSACSTTSTSTGAPAAPAPAAIAAQICPVALSIVQTLQSPLAPLTVGEKAIVDAAGPTITTACALGQNINLSTAQGLMSAVTQVLATFGNEASLSTQAKSNLFLLQIAINAIVAQQLAAGVTTAAPVTSVSAPPATVPAQ
jgi:hypothetical protein